MAPKQRHLPQLLDRQQTRPQTTVDVVIAVGDLVSAIGELRLQRGLPVRQKAFGDVAKLRGARFRTMFEDAFTCLEHQVQAAKLGVSSEERRVGKACDSTCRSLWSPCP